METLEKSRMCRLCGKQSGIAIDIFDKNENHVRKINAILPILVHEMDLLPKQMCHRCSYKLEEFYNFYVDCVKTDTELKNQLSWMSKENLEEKIITPMVKMNRFKIKTEPPDTINSMDHNNILGHVSESSLLFPASILQHSDDTNTNPMLSCSRCRCLCNKSIKINKSPKEVKASVKITTENQAHSSNVTSMFSEISESNKPKSIDKNVTIENNCLSNNSFKEISINLDNVGIKSDNSDDINLLKSNELNRALRPRKSSVDYMGQKKKPLLPDLKSKFKNKLDMFNPLLVTPVDIKISQSKSFHTSPIIKLEKVDETVKTLRTHKNLEEFNRRIKEFQQKKNLDTHDIKRKKILQREKNLKRKSLQRLEIQLDNRLLKQENSCRKSLQILENPCKSLQTEENSSRKSLQVNENLTKQELQKEEVEIKNNSQLHENQSKKNTEIENSKMNEQCSNAITKNNKCENIIKVKDFKIKREVVNKSMENNESSEQVGQEKIFQLELSKSQKVAKLIDRLPLCAVVKLEKDYTCNVDYPRIKIKRHLAISNSSKLQNGTIEVPLKEKSVFNSSMERKSIDKNDGSISPKNLRSKEKRTRLNINDEKLEKSTKKKGKQLDLNAKQTVLEKSSMTMRQTDFKRYCEECDLCFKNKELYQLHPCYQK